MRTHTTYTPLPTAVASVTALPSLAHRGEQRASQSTSQAGKRLTDRPPTGSRPSSLSLGWPLLTLLRCRSQTFALPLPAITFLSPGTSQLLLRIVPLPVYPHPQLSQQAVRPVIGRWSLTSQPQPISMLLCDVISTTSALTLTGFKRIVGSRW